MSPLKALVSLIVLTATPLCSAGEYTDGNWSLKYRRCVSEGSASYRHQTMNGELTLDIQGDQGQLVGTMDSVTGMNFKVDEVNSIFIHVPAVKSGDWVYFSMAFNGQLNVYMDSTAECKEGDALVLGFVK